jgi:transcriptional regulator with XRE-family HTH domain
VAALADVRARLGERVRRIRLDRGMTQEEVAERCGLSYKFVGEVERGTANPSLETLDKLATALGVELGHLFGPQLLYTTRASETLVVRDVRATLEGLLARLENEERPPRARRPRKR